MYIAVDAMGGDFAPQAIVEGAIQATQEYGVSVLLVGDREKILYELARNRQSESSQIAIQHASEVVEMGDSSVAALRRKRDSSLRVAFKQMKDGQIFHVLTRGQGNMAPYAAQLDPAERWKVVTYLRSLQGGAR